MRKKLCSLVCLFFKTQRYPNTPVINQEVGAEIGADIKLYFIVS